MRRPALPPIVARAALVLSILSAGSARDGLAQLISGQVVDSLSGTGIAGSYVLLLDSAGREVARTLSDQRGRFELRATKPGTYRVSARRIGFRPTESPVITLKSSTLTGYRLTVTSIPVTLGAVVVEGKPRCGGGGDTGSDLAAVWEQVREALGAVSWTARAPYRYRLSLFERALDQFGRAVLRERASTRTGYYQTPFQSAPPDDLVRDGYVVGTQLNRTYFAPDAPVLLSDPFVATHCFSLVANPKDGSLVGLAFQPAPGRRRPDVQGTLWVDRQTAELRSFDYAYANLPPDLPENAAGGQASFLRLPSGAWIIQRWSIRNPIMRRSYSFAGAPVYSLAAVQETGGQVLEVTDARREPVYQLDAGFLQGVVFDSVAQAPLAGATVRILGTDMSATTDGSGRFQVEGPLEGEYRVTFEHPGLDSLGFTPAPEAVTLTRGERAEVWLGGPGEPAVVAALCGDARPAEGQGVLLGTIRGATTGVPLAGARIRATWFGFGSTGNQLTAAGRSLEMVTDSTGDYLLCGVPSDSRVLLRVETAGGVQVETLRLSRHHITVGEKEYATRAGTIWRHDLGPRPGPPGALVATVTDTMGQAVGNAVVQLLGTEAVGVSDRRGRVALRGVPSGSNLLAVRRLGYRPLDRVIEVPPADTLTLAPGAVALAPLPVMLDTAVVTGLVEDRMLKLSGFYERREQGWGDFVTRVEFERYAPQSIYDILRRLPSVDLTFNSLPLASRPGNPSPSPPTFFIRSRRMGSRGCPMVIYLNGTYLGPSDNLGDIDDVLGLNEIEAVEVYQGGADVPPEFNATGSECGVVVIWTRR